MQESTSGITRSGRSAKSERPPTFGVELRPAYGWLREWPPEAAAHSRNNWATLRLQGIIMGCWIININIISISISIPLFEQLLWGAWGLLSQQEVSLAEISNYIPQYVYLASDPSFWLIDFKCFNILQHWIGSASNSIYQCLQGTIHCWPWVSNSFSLGRKLEFLARLLHFCARRGMLNTVLYPQRTIIWLNSSMHIHLLYNQPFHCPTRLLANMRWVHSDKRPPSPDSDQLTTGIFVTHIKNAVFLGISTTTHPEVLTLCYPVFPETLSMIYWNM